MSFDIYFSGLVLPGHEPSEVAEKLEVKTRLSRDKVDILFSGKRNLIKKNLDKAGALKFAEMMSKLGAKVEVHPPLPTDPDQLVLEPIEKEKQSPETKELGSINEEHQSPYISGRYAEGRVFCRYCGGSISPKAHNCPQCGGVQQVGKQRSRGVAATLALFFGGFGIHRLYLGQWWGLVYIFFWPITSLISLVEAIVFLCTKEESWKDKYGNVQGANAIVVAIFALVFGIMIIGILAAIAVPAYQDYTVRSKVSAAITETQEYRDAIAALQQRSGFVATENSDIGLSEPFKTNLLSSIQVNNNGVLILTFSMPSISGQTLVWVPIFTASGTQWDCTSGSLKNRYRPSKCRSDNQESVSAISERRVYSDDNAYSVELGAGWEPIDIGDVSFAFGHHQNDVAVTVLRDDGIDASQDLTFEEYNRLTIDFFMEGLPQQGLVEIGGEVVDGKVAYLFEVSGDIDGMDITYLVATVDNRREFYRVTTWTQTDGYTNNKPTMMAIIKSLEINSGA